MAGLKVNEKYQHTQRLLKTLRRGMCQQIVSNHLLTNLSKINHFKTKYSLFKAFRKTKQLFSFRYLNEMRGFAGFVLLD